MNGKKTRRGDEAGPDQDQESLRNAVIIYAIVEALVLIPVIIYLASR